MTNFDRKNDTYAHILYYYRYVAGQDTKYGVLHVHGK